MARIDDAQKQYFEDLEQEKIDELKLFKERQQEEQKLVQKALQNRLVGETFQKLKLLWPNSPTYLLNGSIMMTHPLISEL